MISDDKWKMISEVMERFSKVDGVGIVSYDVWGEKVYIFVVIYNEMDSEELRQKLSEVEKSVLKDFPELNLEICYI